MTDVFCHHYRTKNMRAGEYTYVSRVSSVVVSKGALMVDRRTIQQSLKSDSC